MALTALVAARQLERRWRWCCSASSAPRSSTATASSPRRSRCSRRWRGSTVAAPSLADFVVPITIAVLCVLFAVQRFGTRVVGRFFGPVMVVWFVVIGIAGLRRGGQRPRGHQGALADLRPRVHRRRTRSWPSSPAGAVVLAITGAEALYADMGHFGASPIRRVLVPAGLPGADPQLPRPGRADPARPLRDREPLLPALPRLGAAPDGRARDRRHGDRVAVGHLGGLLGHPAGRQPRLPAPRDDPAHVRPRDRPGLRAARQLDACSSPWSGWCSPSGSSQRLAAAYGIAVTGTFIVNTILFLAVARWIWKWPTWRATLFGVVFLSIETLLFAANTTKIAHGRLGRAPDRGGHLHRPHHLAARARDRDRAAHRGGGPVARLRRPHRRRLAAGRAGARAPPSSCTPPSRPRRWRCGPTSSTTTCSTRASSSSPSNR